jgi:hypothetical protein
MEPVNCYVLTTEAEGDDYAQLIEFCCSIASKMLVVVRDPGRTPDPRTEEKLAALSSFRTEAVLAKEWPGTILFGHEATVYWHRVAPGLAQLLRQMESRLFAWLVPSPEDLCFLREDGRAILVTTSHEGDAYLLLTEEEHRQLSAQAPRLASILRFEGVAG